MERLVNVGIEAIKSFYRIAFEGDISAELTGPVRVAGDSVAFPFKAVWKGTTTDIIDVFQFNEKNEVISMKAFWSEENQSPPGAG